MLRKAYFGVYEYWERQVYNFYYVLYRKKRGAVQVKKHHLSLLFDHETGEVSMQLGFLI